MKFICDNCGAKWVQMNYTKPTCPGCGATRPTARERKKDE